MKRRKPEADWHPGGHTPSRITLDPKVTNIPKGPAPGAPNNQRKATTMSEIGLGDLVEDTVSGYLGVVTCVAHYLHGVDRLCVVARSEGKITKITEEYFDRGRLIKIG